MGLGYGRIGKGLVGYRNLPYSTQLFTTRLDLNHQPNHSPSTPHPTATHAPTPFQLNSPDFTPHHNTSQHTTPHHPIKPTLYCLPDPTQLYPKTTRHTRPYINLSQPTKPYPTRPDHMYKILPSPRPPSQPHSTPPHPHNFLTTIFYPSISSITYNPSVPYTTHLK